MKTSQTTWQRDGGWSETPNGVNAAQLVFAFGSTSAMRDPTWLTDLRSAYPQAHVIGCSTAGEIRDIEVCDESLVATAVEFEDTRIECVRAHLDDADDSHAVGARLAGSLATEGLVHVFVISEGLQVNGSELVAGLTSNLPEGVTVTGGLSGDGDRFEQTLVLADGEAPAPGEVAVLGMYGERLKVGYASLGGWDPFGPERLITRATGNVLHELDGKSALALYKEYLGEHADGLPATGLLYPLAVRFRDGATPVVRTILAVDEETQSMTFAGDVPEGAFAQLMKANFDRLVDGAAGAARSSYEAIGSSEPDLAILISCVGRKLVLRQRIEEEVEAVREVLGAGTTMTGFYSYGEISPFTPNAACQLHNQTMTITAFSER